MKNPGYLVLLALLVLALAVGAGCSAPQQAPATPQASTPQATAAQPTYQAPQATRTAASSADLDTTIRVHYNDLACINVGDFLGVTYLYPDQSFKLEAAPPGANTINPNVLFVDENDQLALRQAKPQWDQVKKSWRYESVVPLVQFNDITTSVEKTFIIKRQSKYYICADDRKEAGTNDITYQVPVKLTKM